MRGGGGDCKMEQDSVPEAVFSVPNKYVQFQSYCGLLMKCAILKLSLPCNLQWNRISFFHSETVFSFVFFLILIIVRATGNAERCPIAMAAIFQCS